MISIKIKLRDISKALDPKSKKRTLSEAADRVYVAGQEAKAAIKAGHKLQKGARGGLYYVPSGAVKGLHYLTRGEGRNTTAGKPNPAHWKSVIDLDKPTPEGVYWNEIAKKVNHPDQLHKINRAPDGLAAKMLKRSDKGEMVVPGFGNAFGIINVSDPKKRHEAIKDALDNYEIGHPSEADIKKYGKEKAYEKFAQTHNIYRPKGGAHGDHQLIVPNKYREDPYGDVKGAKNMMQDGHDNGGYKGVNGLKAAIKLYHDYHMKDAPHQMKFERPSQHPSGKLTTKTLSRSK